MMSKGAVLSQLHQCLGVPALSKKNRNMLSNSCASSFMPIAWVSAAGAQKNRNCSFSFCIPWSYLVFLDHVVMVFSLYYGTVICQESELHPSNMSYLCLSSWTPKTKTKTPNKTRQDKTPKTPNPKCRLYWCFIEFIDWRYNRSCWYFRTPSCELAPL